MKVEDDNDGKEQLCPRACFHIPSRKASRLMRLSVVTQHFPRGEKTITAAHKLREGREEAATSIVAHSKITERPTPDELPRETSLECVKKEALGQNCSVSS